MNSSRRAACWLGLLVLAACKQKDSVVDKKVAQMNWTPAVMRYYDLGQQIPVAEQTYVHGKVLFVAKDTVQPRPRTNQDTGMLVVDTELQAMLPSSLAATKADEVQSVAEYRCREEVVGRYDGGSSGYVWVCDLAVVDLDGPTRMMPQTFRGSEPPRSVSGSGGAQKIHGAPPFRAMADHIAQLPRR